MRAVRFANIAIESVFFWQFLPSVPFRSAVLQPFAFARFGIGNGPPKYAAKFTHERPLSSTIQTRSAIRTGRANHQRIMIYISFPPPLCLRCKMKVLLFRLSHAPATVTEHLFPLNCFAEVPIPSPISNRCSLRLNHSSRYRANTSSLPPVVSTFPALALCRPYSGVEN